uniref:Uncharacterized protein n=2 Tax=Oryza sativa subsp. japonica TaxID=39947 RepID=Q7G7B1_ORYSJ|nr:hypothetical protein [Oryza sativa Japonica Group]AAP12908.1 hypothetical protein Os03g40290 [Oryza sativa Japonica Group]ABF97478.1 hypothetical protein LOC_Os03g40290 [Oryza sativa Japonica Group]
MAAARPTLDGVPSLCVEDGPARGGESDDAGWRRWIQPPHGWIWRLHAGSGRSKLLLCGVNGRRRWQRLATRRLAAAGTGGRRARKTQWRPAAEVAVAKADSGGRGGGGCDGRGCGARQRASSPPPPPAAGGGGFGLDGLCTVAGSGWRCADPRLVVGSVAPAAGCGLNGCGLRCSINVTLPSNIFPPLSSLLFEALYNCDVSLATEPVLLLALTSLALIHHLGVARASPLSGSLLGLLLA